MKFMFFIFCCVLPGFANASESCLNEPKRLINRWLWEMSEHDISFNCKSWPEAGVNIITARISRQDEMDLEVVMQDLDSGGVIGHFIQKSELSGRAIFNYDVEVDTDVVALHLKDKTFGVRAFWRNSSQPNPYSRQTLSLYSMRNGELVKVLDSLLTNKRYGEWDTHCQGAFTNKEVRISEKTPWIPHGVLFVTEATTESVSHKTKDGCFDTVDKVGIENYTLVYNGYRYEIPEGIYAPNEW